MAYGDSPHDQALRAAWIGFCERLQAAGEQVFKDYNPPTPLHRADGFRFLTQNLGQAFDFALETKDTLYPALHQFCTPYCKLGGDAADFTYTQAWIDGESVYKLSGNKGTAPFLNFTVQGPRPEVQPGTSSRSLHDPFGDIPEANLFGHELHCSWDGNFDLYIGGPRREPNWLPTTPGSRKLFVRQGFDRWDDLPARMSIERVGMIDPRPLPTPDTIVNALTWAGRFVSDLMNDWPDWPYEMSKRNLPQNLNRFPDVFDDSKDDQRRGRAIAGMTWSLRPDEAMILEFDRHDGLWMVSLSGLFFNSMDYLYRPVSYTPSRAQVDGDGKIRLILSHDDCGYHNWLDTQGFETGNLTYRLLQADAPPPLGLRVVKRANLEHELRTDCARTSPEERTAQMKARFDSVRRRYGL
jgi:hypothetical protein